MNPYESPEEISIDREPSDAAWLFVIAATLAIEFAIWVG